jgi:Ca-activated chloride channel homolog
MFAPWHFEYEPYLYGLAAVPVLIILYVLWLRWKTKIRKNWGTSPVLNELVGRPSALRLHLKLGLSVLALACCILALANWRRPGKGENINRSGINLFFALDVSKSMLAQDLQPNRLERAKLLINKLTDQLPNDKTGLVIFAGRAYLQMPLTTDQATARMLVNNAQPESAPTQGTVISEALRLCNSSFNIREKKYKAVVLITDGEDHDDKAVSRAKALKDSGVMVIAVGMGSETGTPIIDPLTKDFKKDINGNTVKTKLNAALLRDIANATGGAYIYYQETDKTIAAIRAQLNKIDIVSMQDKSFINYDSAFTWLLLAAVIFLIIEILLSESGRIKTNKLQPVS